MPDRLRAHQRAGRHRADPAATERLSQGLAVLGLLDAEPHGWP